MSFFRRLFSKKKKVEPKQTGQIPKGYSKKEIPKKKIQKPGKDGFITKVMPIEKFTAPEVIQEGEILKIAVSGHFSNAGWKLKEAYAKLHGDKIVLTVIGQIKEGIMAAQVLKRYDTVIEYGGLKKGIYQILVEKGITDQTQLAVE